MSAGDPTPDVEVVVQTQMPGLDYGARVVLTATPFVQALIASGRLMTGAAWDAAVAQTAAGVGLAVTDVTVEVAQAAGGLDPVLSDAAAEAAQVAADAAPGAGDVVV